jgi:hypothetical protein
MSTPSLNQSPSIGEIASRLPLFVNFAGFSPERVTIAASGVNGNRQHNGLNDQEVRTLLEANGFGSLGSSGSSALIRIRLSSFLRTRNALATETYIAGQGVPSLGRGRGRFRTTPAWMSTPSLNQSRHASSRVPAENNSTPTQLGVGRGRGRTLTITAWMTKPS